MRPLLHTLLALAVFTGVSAGVRSTIPWPDELGLRAKLEYLEAHADEFDALFIGSSRVFRGIVPRVLERELAEQGRELRAFNLGVGGMEDFEADHVLRSVLEQPGDRLRLVLVEAGRWDPRPDDFGNTMTQRTVEWHTLAGARNVLEALLTLDLTPRERLAEGRRHAVLCAMRLVGYGRGRDAWRELVGTRRPGVDPRIQGEQELARNLGWQVMTGEGVPLDERSWSRQVREIERNESRGAGAGPAALARFPVGAVRRQIEFVQERVPKLVYLTLPNSQGPVFARAMHALEIFPDYLSYDLPSRYPGLFSLDRRVDSNHLNQRGAIELTTLLASDLAERLRRDP